MAKKFFNDRVHNTKRTIINLVIIGVCIIGVIVCFIITSNFQGENHNTPEATLSIKREVTIEINDQIKTEIFFSKIENTNIDNIEVLYPENFNLSKPGMYTITLVIDSKDYYTNLYVVDTTKPDLEVKELTIREDGSYNANDFIKNCIDNSNDKCNISFYEDGVDEEGKPIDYSKYKNPGTYAIKISAKDSSGNQIVKETKLTIGNKQNTNENKPVIVNCKYGNSVYDKNNYLVAIDITTNGCAVSLDLYKDASMTTEINKLMNTESTRIKKDVDKLNINGTLALNRKVTAVINTTGDGIVGYELRMTVTMSKKDKTETIVDYKVDANGERAFITNPYKLTK